MISSRPLPRVSVVVPAYNAADALPLQLEALSTQAGDTPIEVIVVDNGSTDATSSVIDAWSRRSTDGFAVRRVEARDHQGPGYARNVGAAHARAKLLMFADADDVVSRWWIMHGLRAFQESCLWTGKTVDIVETDFPADVAAVREWIRDSDEWTPLIHGDTDFEYPIMLGGGFGCTAEVYRRIGGFDQSFGTLYEDNEFGIRAHRKGIAVDQADAVRLAYRIRGSRRMRSRLIRRASALHVMAVCRHGLGPHPRLVKPLRDLVGALGAAGLMRVGVKEPDYEAVRDRLAASVGLLHGGWKYKVRGKSPAAMVGAGLHASR